MRPSSLGWALASFTTLKAVAAASTSMPDCALECLAEYLPSSACHVATNITCICSDAELTKQMSTCVSAGCSVRDGLLTERFNAETCDWPVTNDSLGLKVITPLFGVLAVIVFCLRVWARWLTGLMVAWGADDWVMLATVITSIPLTIVSYLFASRGLGQDLWMVPFENITFVLEMYYYSEILYLVVVFLTKISICCFYLRVFPKRALRIRIFSVIGVTLAAACAFIFVTIFQCTPIPGAWLRWDGTYEAECRDVMIQALWGAIVSIVLDVATIMLPMKEVWGLNLSIRRKVGVVLMFAVGMFVVVVQILRIVFLLKFSATSNFTRDYTSASVWSNVEAYVGIICACFPHIRTLLTHLAPRIFATTKGGKSSTSGVYPGSKGRSQFSQRPVHGDETDFVELRAAPAPQDGFNSVTDLTQTRGSEKYEYNRHAIV
ncbi:uncharacterized protein JN550_008972 [Neoarthrinium moseri]|uniref:uncharacterized protein n=1 Tax=Neoarthrinium moseri TaxID=1658444 RepID=UPI001FDC0D20|nr:uncharacterized protein JN550_008972 [Neoarthrinium moseri]KAI1864415.1 hypothetical protein JN550_008972 [Neoarthrinium moseri]